MARDYKHAGRGEPKKHKQKPVWVVFVLGLAAGLLLSGLVQVREHGLPDSFTDWLAGLQKGAQQKPPQKEAPATAVKAEEKPRPRFDFYSILPEQEVPVPEWQQTGPGGAKLEAGRYVLQAGSFRLGQEAERLKAEIALKLGIQADIQSVAVNGKDTWHRVRIGPLDDIARIDLIRKQLADNGIDAILLRMRETAAE